MNLQKLLKIIARNILIDYKNGRIRGIGAIAHR